MPACGRGGAVTCIFPPSLLLSRGTVRALEATEPSPPLDLASLLDGLYEVDATAFSAGDSPLPCTDGVSEGRDDLGVFHPLAEGVERWATAAFTASGGSPRR